MGVTFTKEQQQVIDLRNRNILVSAAAGSGKTAVLVERIVTRLTRDEKPLNVDELLIVTFTEAAASEMKERIHSAIEKALEEEPDNVHLQRQATLIHQAQITTIHKFCLSVIRASSQAQMVCVLIPPHSARHTALHRNPAICLDSDNSLKTHIIVG